MQVEVEGIWGLSELVIPPEVFGNHNLTHTQMFLFGYLKILSRSERGCWATNEYLGNLLRVGRRTVIEAISTLSELGYIIIKFKTTRKGTERSIFINPDLYKNYRKIAELADSEEGVQKIATPVEEGGGGAENCNPGVQKIAPNKSLLGYKSIEKQYVSDDEAQKQPLPTRSSRTIPVLPPDPPTRAEIKASRNKQLLPLAEQLANIIRSHKKINIKLSQIESWSDDIRMLVDEDHVNPGRVKRALDWYSKHIGEEYVVVILSGGALRDKFLRLEDKMEADKPQPYRKDPESLRSNTEYKNVRRTVINVDDN